MAMSPRLLRPIASSLDPDAAVYLNAVAAADGEQLEPAVKKAINDFVKGCKSDGFWDAIKASCILAGARTLAGALVPLKGSAPTNNGPFVSGDYNRETGLVGNGSTKFLDSSRPHNADPQDDFHMSVYVSAVIAYVVNGSYIGIGLGAAGSSRITPVNATSGGVMARSIDTVNSGFSASPPVNFLGVSRDSAAAFSGRFNGGDASFTKASATASASNITVYRSFPGAHANARLAFYSIGESLNLALLDTRVSALITAIGAAI